VSRPQGWGAAACPSSTDKGFAVGQTLGDLGVRDCETGAPASVDEACGAKAAWIFAAHTHCPTCRSTAGFTDEVAQAVAGKDVAVVHLVYDDNGTSCAKWKEAYKLAGITNVFVYDDPKGVAFAKLKTSNYTAPSAFLDKNRVVTYKEHGLSKAQVLSQIDAALAK
jgi:thiol-disulfide isomerase/thioredoxin